jgi:16S rRNA (guanine527-N7)-methyltransferase
MDQSRIAELLEPFLAAPLIGCHSQNLNGGHSDPPNACHSEPAKAGEEPASSCHSEPAKAGEEPASSCHSEPAKAGEEPASLSPAQLQDISTYIDLLLRWNARINLTAIRDPEEIVTRHFGESLFAASNLFPRSSSVPSVVKAFDSVADVGSGAGFPGLPIKLWAPEIELTLIESNHKKATFLREVTRALTLTNIDIQTVRAESLPGDSFRTVTLRAVERFEKILPTAASLVAPGGRLALLIGSAQFSQARSILPALSWSDPCPIPQSDSRILATATFQVGGLKVTRIKKVTRWD